MTRVVTAPQYGLEHLTIADEPTPEPADDEVLIAVTAAALNPMDVKRVDGQFGRDPQALPLRPGVEVSGVVAAVGPDAAVAVGDEVIGYRVAAGLATHVLTTSDQVYAKPPGLAWDEAAGLLLAGTTAWHLVDAVGAAPETTVVVMAASGAVGSLAVQLALHRGADVIGVGSPGSLDFIASLGAQPASIEDLDAVVAGRSGAIAAFDTVGTDATLDAVARVADPGRTATIAGYAHAAELGIPALGGAPGADPGMELRLTARRPLIDLAAAGVLRVRIARAFGIDDARAAFELVATGHPGGKVLISGKEHR